MFDLVWYGLEGEIGYKSKVGCECDIGCEGEKVLRRVFSMPLGVIEVIDFVVSYA